MKKRSRKSTTQSKVARPKKLKQSPHITAKDALCPAPSSTEGPFPFRDPHLTQISAYVEAAIRDKQGCCVYVSGVPGTGKTSTTKEAVRQLKLKLPGQFRSCEINGMSLTDPVQAYVLLWESVNNGKRLNALQSQRALDDYFSGNASTYVKDNTPVVVVMDELDMLVMKKQELVYNFFDWPTKTVRRKQQAPLIVIAIANTMNLPETILTNKVRSRLGLRRVEFLAYTYAQLSQICTERVGELRLTVNKPLFEPTAIELCARKVAAVSGDARRVLDVTRRAVEMAQQQQDSQITTKIINEAYASMYSSPTCHFLNQSASLYQKISLCAILLLMRQKGVSDQLFGEIFERSVQLCLCHGVIAPTCSDMTRVVTSLGALRILRVQSPHQRNFSGQMQVSLLVPEEDVRECIVRDDQVAQFYPSN